MHFAAVNRHPVVCTLFLHSAHSDKADKPKAEMVAWRMDGGAEEVLSEWVVDMDRELMERDVANREKGGKERGNLVRALVQRLPFLGPDLAIRILGPITHEQDKILQHAVGHPTGTR
ncbi:hypothetical protein PILCRDRAFT_93354 [Piloderma croceum F 1598]|uniref:Uncharacterized protein n=1 Tax=Piloderma croceum (strain F 1598) TaxID=765440 RepID=A0A0C3EY91_PILCF|nr:hypothetical protein PILCRDRAFT_93354 [Piloderma croceum F 1598]